MQILITYSSGFGTTREVAEKIGQILQKADLLSVDLLPIDEVSTVAPYDTVILGSSIRAGHPLANMVDFIALHRHHLESKRVAIFLVCLCANSEEGRCKAMEDQLPQLLRRFPNLHPFAVEAFGGKIDFDKLNPVMRKLMRHVLEQSGLPADGSVDTRDWKLIEQWALRLRDELASAARTSPVTADK
ncbi:MAG TPA: flavodoxin domain-containing protein [bacterium]|nr:flavodoxin domain-containing protein [bacterium]